MAGNYWNRITSNRIARRRLLRSGAALSVGAAALALGAVLIGPSLVPGRLSSAEAADLARHDPQVAAYLRGEIIDVEVTSVVGDVATVVVQDASGGQVTVAVDVRSRVATVTYHGPQLSDALLRTALEVVRADPRTAALLARGATPGRTMPIVVEMSGVDPETGETFSESQTWAQVPLRLDGQEWVAYVDLPSARISQLVDPSGGQVPLP